MGLMSTSGNANRYPSPLRYPGGKGKIANYVKLLMLENNLIGSDYVEPFAGGASVALSLLYEDFADEVHINDLNPGVHAFWNAAVHRTDDLCELITTTPVDVDTWQQQRAVLDDPNPDPLQLAFATFFLNRCNRSGIISGGVIGGLNQTGPYLIDARYNKPELIRRIRKVGRHRSRIHLTGMDAAEYLEGWIAGDHRTLIYLDPPYFVKGEGLYDNFYSSGDHARVAALVHQLPQSWIVSYDAVPEILALYRDDERIRYSLSYSAHSARATGDEVMFFSADTHPPERRPSGIPMTEVLRGQIAH